MKKFYVETYRPPYPQGGIGYTVHAEKDYFRDILSCNMTAVFEVDCCRTKQEAIALVLEFAAGFPVSVRRILGGKA